ncbi:MAG: hypothetical protein PHP95_10570 [Desulfuromonadaceae bacterium]|nr:hypothetical protein [Desulfuromonadaceae bacterium]MDD2848889.1 hypothetical protein [Desulfuromonadaceae bacterium]MDD4132154.1 hypothetical protein [Desulfuromonadaceae bacterium]
MTKETAVKLFEHRQVRTKWDEEKQNWCFSIVDVIAVLIDSPNPKFTGVY